MEGKSFNFLTEEECHRLLHDNTATVRWVGPPATAVPKLP